MSKDIVELNRQIIQFREERDWKQFHTIKDLLIGLNIEVGELQELFLWKTDQDIQNIDKASIEDEIADIYIFLTYICAEFDIDLLTSVEKKILLNREKYPIAKSRGSNKKYNQLK